MWGPYSPAAEWLQSYAIDFLLRARDQQMAVPAASLQRGLTWLERTVDKMSPNAQAYAWYVLAKAGLADAGRVRYFQDTNGGKIIGGLAWAQLAAALNQVGEPGRARLAFGKAREQVDERDPRLLRLGAARSRSAAGAGAGSRRPRGLAPRWRAGARAADRGGRGHDDAGAGLAGAGGARHGRRRRARLLGRRRAQKAATEPVVINPDAAAIARGLRVRNEGDGTVWMQVTARGVPTSRCPRPAQGLSVVREFLTLDGRPADLARCARTTG